MVRGNLSSFAVDRHRDLDDHVCVQRHANGVVANHLDGAMRHTDLSFGNWEAFFRQRFRDVVVSHRTEQAAIHTGFLAEF